MKNFITFEGCEGVGKTTQVRLVYEHLLSNGFNAISTREPGGSQIAEKIRGIILDKNNKALSPMAELLLYLAARSQHLEDIIKPALQSNKIVLCDRYTDSTYAYQGIARELGADEVNRLNAITVGEFMPEFTVFLDCHPRLAFQRKGGIDTSDRMESEGLEFHTKVYEGYKQIAASEPHRFISVDASGTREETHKKVLHLLRERGVIA